MRRWLLARDLICKVAKIDQAALGQLYCALRKGNEGHANGIIERINKKPIVEAQLSTRVGSRPGICVAGIPAKHDLVSPFETVRTPNIRLLRRSSGLKYFLSYYIQYLAHEPKGVDTEILLMDEPDAYLSSQAQQDLLKIFKAFSEPEKGKRPVQVIYVTHSPFLIDKNNSDRIRVLEKGAGDEGTRVVSECSSKPL